MQTAIIGGHGRLNWLNMTRYEVHPDWLSIAKSSTLQPLQASAARVRRWLAPLSIDTPSLGKQPDDQIKRNSKIYVDSATLSITMSTQKDMRRVDLGECYSATADCESIAMRA